MEKISKNLVNLNDGTIKGFVNKIVGTCAFESAKHLWILNKFAKGQ